ncbi:MAG: hypothetical protein Q7S33_03995 [Nanoarchaeota archaeon]|nr:hypothetical protein [Nanoarchaeota archaeon]
MEKDTDYFKMYTKIRQNGANHKETCTRLLKQGADGRSIRKYKRIFENAAISLNYNFNNETPNQERVEPAKPLPDELAKKIQEKNYDAYDHLNAVYFDGISPQTIKKSFEENGKSESYRPIAVGAAQRLRGIENSLKSKARKNPNSYNPGKTYVVDGSNGLILGGSEIFFKKLEE